MGTGTAVLQKTTDFLDSALNYLEHKARKIWKYICRSDAWQLAGILTLVALACFITTYLTNMFTIPLGGDFVLQMIPFQFKGYDDWHSFFKTGVFPTWDSAGIFGFSNIGGNSYYYLFDPWFLIMLFFPRAWLPQIQGILTVVKLVCGGVLFYHYLKSFKISVTTRKIGAVCYAFCGWTFYFLWFHFINLTAVLPLVLWGIERVIQKKKPVMLIGSLTLLCLINYYFFVSFCIGTALYAIFRVLQECKHKSAQENLKIVGMGMAAYGIAILTVAVVLIPSILNTLNMPRVNDSQNFLLTVKAAKGLTAKLKLIFTWSEPYKVTYPLNTFLFAPLGCFSAPLFDANGYDNTVASIYVLAPMMLMLVPSILDSIKQKKISHLIGVGLVTLMLFTPFAYYMMFAFVKEYGRWQILPTMWMLVFFLIHFDRRKQMPRWYMDASVVFIGLLYAIMIPLAFKYANDPLYSTVNGSRWGKAFNPLTAPRTYAIPLQIAWVFICYVVMRFNFHKTKLNNYLLVMACFEAIVIGNVTVRVQGLSTYQDLSGGLANVNEETKIVNRLKKYDDSYFRIFNTSADRGSNNLSLREGYNGVGAFHSVYAYNAQDFINWSRIPYTNGNWSMGVHEKRYNLDTFLGVKYYLVKKPAGTDTRNIPYGYTDIRTAEDCPADLKKILDEGSHELYVNENFIDTGFAFDEILTSSHLSSGTYEDYNEEKYLKYGIVEAEDIDEIVASSPDLKAVAKTVTDINSEYTSSDVVASYKIYRANFDENGYLIMGEAAEGEPNPDIYGIYKGDTELDYNKDNATGLPYLSKVVADLKPGHTICPDAETRGGCYASIGYLFGYNIDFAFFDADGQKIVNDMHMWNGYDKTYDWKMARGFYLDRPATRVVATWKDNIIDNYTLSRFPIYYQYNDTYQGRIDTLKQSALKDLKHVSDALITFKTDYDKDKFVVTNIAFDEGWSLKRRDLSAPEAAFEPLKIYKGQGGFTSFIALTGDYEYTLEYVTPGLSFGKSMTMIGLLAQMVVIASYYWLHLDHRLDESRKFDLKKQKPRKFPTKRRKETDKL